MSYAISLTDPMTALPTDTARCPGRITHRPLGSVAGVRVTSNAGHSECVRCRRREPSAPDQPSPHMEPPKFAGGLCPMRIAP